MSSNSDDEEVDDVTPTTSSEANDGAGADEDDVVVKVEGKKVQRIQKTNTSIASKDSSLQPSATSSNAGEVYVRADGKKVRRVKRKKVKPEDEDAEAKDEKEETTAEQSKSPAAVQEEEAETKEAVAAQTLDHWEAVPGKDSLPTFPPPVFSTEMSPPDEVAPPAAEPVAEMPAPVASTAEDPAPLLSVPSELEPEPVVTLDEPDAESETPSESVTVASPPPPAQEAPKIEAVDGNFFLDPPPAAEEALFTPHPALAIQRTGTVESIMTAASDDVHNPWTSAPSCEDSLDHIMRSTRSQKDDASLTSAVVNPFAVIPETPPEPQREASIPPPAVPATTSNENISYDSVAPPSNDDSFDPVNRMAGAAAQALKQDFNTSTDDDETNNFMPSFNETPRNAVAAPTEIFDDEPSAATDEERPGGPLWKAASYEAETMSQQQPKRNKPRLPESIRAHTQSRADVDSFAFEHSAAASRSTMAGGGVISYDRSMANMHTIDADDDAYIMNATLARKRVRVVQLLVFGLLGFLLAFLGSFYVQSTCHFANAQVSVGANSQVFELHYGLWKYSPIDSAFQGYSYCATYDDGYTADSPILPRVAGIVGLVAGAYSLTVMWTYLIMGRAAYKLWLVAVGMAMVAGICQCLTFVFFAGAVCQRNTCTVGPGAAMGIVSTIMWFLVSYELYYNMPTSVMMTHINPGRNGANLMANLEMMDFSEGARSYVERIQSRDGGGSPLPTLNAIQRKKGGSSVGSGFNPLRRQGVYKPPDYTTGDDTYDL